MEAATYFQIVQKKFAYKGGGEYRQMRQNIRNDWNFDDNWIILSTSLYVGNFSK